MSDQELKDEVAKIVASCDLAQMTKRSVLAALTSKFGESALAGKVDMVKSAIVEEVAKREEQSAGKEEEQREEQRDAKAEKTAPKKRAKAPEKSSKAAAAAPAKKKKKDEEADVENPLDALPTNVEAEVDLTSFLRRNPGRTGRVVTKAKPVKKAKKERDPNKPKKPGLPLHLSTPMAEFMGTKISTRTEVTAKIRALIKEKNLQDPKDGRNILLHNDPALAKLWPSNKKTTYFKLAQLISKHLFKKGEYLGSESEEEGDGNEEEEEEEEKQEEDGKGNAVVNEEKERPAASTAAPAVAGIAADATTAN